MNRLEDHYMVTAGYRYQVDENVTLEPSVLIKYVSPVPIKIDVSLRATYQDMLWVGGSWRSNDAWVAMAGYEWNEAFVHRIRLRFHHFQSKESQRRNT